MRALSLLYRYDLGGNLTATLMFQLEGPGGAWHVDVSPGAITSAEGMPANTLRLAEDLIRLAVEEIKANPCHTKISSGCDRDLGTWWRPQGYPKHHYRVLIKYDSLSKWTVSDSPIDRGVFRLQAIG